MSRAFSLLIIAALAAGFCGGAAASQPRPWQMGMQEPASPVMERIAGLHDFLTIVIVAIVSLVTLLLGYVVWRFRAGRHPVPSTRTHNTWLEITWTAVPAAILAVIAVPSLNLLYFMDRAEQAEMTIKITGHQWYWSYEYPDHDGIAFDAFMKGDDELEPGEPRLLATDNRVVLPVGVTVRLLITSDDVIHSWALPALGLKTDGVPGRINETWVRIERPGTYYGQCSELCGVLHGFMPVAVQAVSRPEFAAWVDEKRGATP